jgi:voltage-dependent calcium channel L type alpha-1D
LFKMVQQWKSLHSLLNTIGRAAADVRSFGVLLFLFVFIYALVGMQLFSNRLHFDELTGAHISIGDPKYSTSEIPRSNFDGLFISVTTIFQVLSGENWNEVMYDCWKATSWIAPLFFISLVVLGIFIVLNLFLAILLKQFDDDEPPDGSQRQLLPETEHVEVESASILSRALRRMKKCVSALAHCNAATQTCQYPEFYSRCKGILENKRFDLTVTIAIILSSIVLALDNPLNDPDTPFSVALEVLNYLFTAIFIAEFLFKVAAYGPLTYFSEAWNILDFSAVAASVLEMFNIGAGKSLRAMRTLRVLRPLKMINRFPEIKLVGEL